MCNLLKVQELYMHFTQKIKINKRFLNGFSVVVVVFNC
jgi:hypothetical protein